MYRVAFVYGTRGKKKATAPPPPFRYVIGLVVLVKNDHWVFCSYTGKWMTFIVSGAG